MEAEPRMGGLFVKRLPIYVFVTILIALILIAFSFYYITFNAINVDRVKATENEINKLRKNPVEVLTFQIFSNNYIISLNFLAPFSGQMLFIAVMYQTAEIFANRSIGLSSQLNLSPYTIVVLYIISLLFDPGSFFFGFLEFLGYALTFSQNFFLISSTIKSIKSKSISYLFTELRYTLIISIISALILLLAAFLEAFAIAIYS